MPFIRSMGTTLHYGVSGDGSPVVALHGSASSGAQWRSLSGYLGGRHRVLTPDLAGCGRSGRIGGPAGLSREAAFLAPLLAAQAGPVHLVGHSFGGAVALEIAALLPGLVRSLTLFEPCAFRVLDGAEPDLADEIGTVADTIAARAATGEHLSAMAAFIDYWNGPGAWARTSAELRARLLPQLESVLDHFSAIAATPSRLDAIIAPVLVLAGLDTPLPALRTAELVAERIPQARLLLVPEVGHMAPITDPHLIDPLVGAHIAGIPAMPLAVAA
jgi:pimeloyl-ACP methyl ester carboxylesterase